VSDATLTIGRVQVRRWPAADSAGEPAVVEDFESVADDLRAVVQATRDDLPVVMVGQSIGGAGAGDRGAQLPRSSVIAALRRSMPRRIAAPSSVA
jgi:alpha-beta hydrolase superfamily lysophospholipase